MRISARHVTSAITGGLLVAACNGAVVAIGPSSTEEPTPVAEDVKGTVAAAKPAVPHAVGGTVAGLSGRGLVLQLNGGEELVVGVNGRFTFPAKLAKGAAFGVTIKSQPTAPNQVCALGGDAGTMGDADVKSVTVDCFTDKYIVGGTAQGVAGTGVVLQLNGGNDVHVSANGKWSFPAPLASQALYGVTVKTKPTNPSQTCSVSNGLGMVPDGGVSSILVVCRTDTYALSGTVTGLAGKGLVLRNESWGEDLPVAADGAFTFKKRIVSKGSFDVTVKTQPSDVTQSCTSSGGRGTDVNGDVSSITVNCSTTRFALSGTTSGLAGPATLLLNGVEHTVTSNGALSLGTLPSGTSYAISLEAKPTSPSQTCSISGHTGTITDHDTTNVALSCTTDAFKLGGSISGATGDVDLMNVHDGGSELRSPLGNGAWAFLQSVPSGENYEIAIKVSPRGQTCTFADGSGVHAGTMGAADVSGLAITCVDRSYTIGGTVSGLAAGDEVELANGADAKVVPTDGSFTFAANVLEGGSYNVTVKTAPTTNRQCTVTNGSGANVSASVTNVSVTCVEPPKYFGNYTVNANGSFYSGSGDTTFGTKIVLATPVTAVGLGAVADASGNIRLALYRDASGSPGTLVAATTGAPYTTTRVEQSITETQLVAGTYWVFVASDNAAGVEANWSSGATAHASFSYASGFPNDLASPYVGTGTMPFYVIGK